MCAGLPQPVNVSASSTNTSVTLKWELPEDLQLDEKTFYNVSFHAYVHVHLQAQLIKGQVNIILRYYKE